MAEESVVVPELSDATALTQAVDHVRPEMDALPDDELMVVNVDPNSSAITVLGIWRLLSSLRPDIVKHLPTFNIGRFDKLPDYARALWLTNAWHHRSLPSTTPLQELSAEGAKLREVLLADVTVLVKRGMLKEEYIADVKSPVSYRGLAQSLAGLAGALRSNWSTVSGRTAVVEAELDRAYAVAHQLVMAVGEREQAPIVQGETAKDRQRAYTLFMRAYADAQRAVRYLREEYGDAEAFAPSLFAGRGGGNIKRKEDPETAAAQPASPTPPASNITLPVPNAGSTVPVGMPGSSPLSS